MNEQYQHRARKRFGQNFLHDAGIIDRILRAINAKAGEHLLEIGPGQGALTEGLLDSAAIEAAGVDGSLRPEQLDLAAFVRLADQLADQQQA